jgi:hypothetical protein
MRGRLAHARAGARRWSRRTAVVGGVAAIALIAVASAAADITPTLIQGGPTVDQVSPAATADFQLWEQNSTLSPGHYDVYARPRAGGTAVKVNLTNTFGFGPSVVQGSPTGAFIYQQAAGSNSNLVFYNPSTRVRTALPGKVNSTAWEYYGVASSKYVAFMRQTAKTRAMYLYNRTTGALSQLATTTLGCGGCLRPTFVGSTHVVWTSCSPSTFVCNVRVHVIGGSTVTVPKAPAPYSAYDAGMDEATGDVYFIRSTSYCGLFVEIQRWSTDGGAPVTIHALDEGIDAGDTSLAPDTTTPGDTDVQYSQFDCISGDDDTYQLASANQAARVAGHAPRAGAARAGGLIQSAADVAAAG